MKVAVVAATDGTDVRISKICRSLQRLGCGVHLIGWDRRPQLAKTLQLGATELHILNRKTRNGRWSLGGYLAFIRHLLGCLRRVKPDVAWAVNEDNGVVICLARGILYRYLVCDVFDALLDRHSGKSGPLRLALRAVSGIVRARADRLIATDERRYERFGRHRPKTVVVCNYPEDPGEAAARTMPRGPVRIWVAGSLFRNRGLEQIVQATSGLDDVEIVSAGWLYDAYASTTFVASPQVRFEGILGPDDALRRAAECDAIYAFYRTDSINNVLASPNKIYDALSIGRPVIINDEVAVAAFIREHDLGYTCAYDDVAALRAIIAGLHRDRERLPAFAERARALFLDNYNWGQMEQRIKAVLDGLPGSTPVPMTTERAAS